MGNAESSAFDAILQNDKKFWGDMDEIEGAIEDRRLLAAARFRLHGDISDEVASDEDVEKVLEYIQTEFSLSPSEVFASLNMAKDRIIEDRVDGGRS